MEFKPLSGREFPRFSGLKTFFRLPVATAQDDFDIALNGVPFDGGTSYRPGARFGPSHVRSASSLGRAYHWPRGENLFQRLRIADVGDCSTVPMSLELTYAKVESHVGELLRAGKRVVSVGGDHSITVPILRALRKHLGKPLSLIHFDAHLDTYPPAWGIEYHHGAFARHAVEEGLIDPRSSWQIGLRGPLAGAEDLDFIRKHGFHSTTVDDIRRAGVEAFASKLPKFTGPTYITYDVDCLDPAFAPGTGTPVPGGLTTYEVQQIFRHLKVSDLRGGDIVEVSPPYDVSDLTALAAVDAMFEMLCLF